MKVFDEIAKCDITKRSYPRSQMIKFVISPSNVLTPDLFGKLDGEEFNVFASKKVLEKVTAMFSERLVVPVEQNNIATLIEKLLSKHIINLICLAKKAGRVVVGYDRIKTALSANKVELLLEAYNLSEKRTIKTPSSRSQHYRIKCMKKQELGKPFGKNSVSQIGFVKSGFTNPLIFDTSRLETLRNY